MICPRCGIPLTRGYHAGGATALDGCAKCRGIWSDAGEIAELAGVPGGGRVPIPANARQMQGGSCPRCRNPLYLFTYPGSLTLVDGCRSCGGTWLDGGELEGVRKAAGRKRMRCPKCDHEQPQAESCARCGIVVRKLEGAPKPAPGDPDAPPGAAPAPRRRNEPLHTEIPGVKGALIRFIDTTLSSLWDSLNRP